MDIFLFLLYVALFLKVRRTRILLASMSVAYTKAMTAMQESMDGAIAGVNELIKIENERTLSEVDER